MNPVRTLVRACRRYSWLRHLGRGRASVSAPVPRCLREVSELRPLSTLLFLPDRTRHRDRC